MYEFNFYVIGVSGEFVRVYFGKIILMDVVICVRGDKVVLVVELIKKIWLSDFRVEIFIFIIGGDMIWMFVDFDLIVFIYLDELGFDYMVFYFFEVEVKFSNDVCMNVFFNVLGNVVENLINEIFYENWGCFCVVNIN